MDKIDDGNIFEFLNGSKSFAGVWFGDNHPLGRFWWRIHLKQAVYERDAKIKELEAELSRIKEGTKKARKVTVLTVGFENMRGYVASDIDRLMKGGE